MAEQKQVREKYSDYVRKTFWRYAVLVVLGMIALFAVLLTLSYKYSAEFENRRYNQRMVSAMAQVYQSYENGCTELSLDPALLEAVNGGSVDAAVARLRDFSAQQKISCYYTVLNAKGQPVCTNLYLINQLQTLASPDTTAALEELSNNPKTVCNRISRAGYSNGQETVYLFANSIRDGEHVKGYLVLELARQSIHALTTDRRVNDIVVADRHQNIIFTTLPTELFYTDENGGVKWNCDWNSRTEVIVDQEPHFATRTPCDTFGRPDIICYTITSTKTMQQAMRYCLIFAVAIGALLIGMTVLLSGFFARRSLSALHALAASTEHWGDGELDYRIPDQPYEEYQCIRDNFNSMMDRTQTLIRSNKELNDSCYQMELRNIESQFNPHFAFNVLETIRCMIAVDPKQASRMVVAFSRLLRYSLHYGQAVVPLQTDLSYIEDYLLLQKQRYGDRLSYHIQAEEQLCSAMVPKLLVQPLVENAIIHNSDLVPSLHVEIKVVQDGRDIIITVRDDGMGMSPRELKEIWNKVKRRESIGLLYVDQILHIRYGDQYGLQLESVENKGTTAIVKIPLEGTLCDSIES